MDQELEEVEEEHSSSENELMIDIDEKYPPEFNDIPIPWSLYLAQRGS